MCLEFVFHPHSKLSFAFGVFGEVSEIDDAIRVLAQIKQLFTASATETQLPKVFGLSPPSLLENKSLGRTSIAVEVTGFGISCGPRSV